MFDQGVIGPRKTIPARGPIKLVSRGVIGVPSRSSGTTSVSVPKTSKSSPAYSPIELVAKPQPVHIQKLPTASDLAALKSSQDQQRARPLSEEVFLDHIHTKTPKKPEVFSAQFQKPQPTESASIELTPAAKKSSKKLRFKSRNIAQYAMVSAALIVFIVGIGVSIMSFRTNQKVVAQTSAPSKKVEASPDQDEAADQNPSEAPLDKNAVISHKAAPDLPRRLIIPKLGVNSRVLSLGLKANNELKTPNTIYDTGWYNKSAKPGEQGATLIDGHVHGPTKPGVFYGLKKLGAGDKIQLERGDGKLLTYKVVKTQVYDAANTDMAAALTAITPGKPGLNLITCTGQLDRTTNHYNERILVFAEQI